VDEATIEAAKNGRRDAQASLVRSLQDVWYRFSLSQLRDPDLAADAAQETALRFLRDLSKFRGGSTIKTWSLGIAVNVAREFRRRRQWSSDAAAADVETGDESPIDSAISAEHVEQLREMLSRLPDRQRESITLRFFEDLSIDETAAAMNVAPGTIKATIHQALRSLKAKMKV
jgi:RNA polymerase sigma-70 factor (ECF subfamily)